MRDGKLINRDAVLMQPLENTSMVNTHYLTKEGREKLEQELQDLKERKKLVSVRIEEAIKMGDLSENAEYSDAKDEQAFIHGRVTEVKEILKFSEIIKKSKKDEVQIGSTVKVKIAKIERVFTIVGSEESSPSEGKISHQSPLGESFIGHKKGDKVEVDAPSGKMVYEIVEIS